MAFYSMEITGQMTFSNLACSSCHTGKKRSKWVKYFVSFVLWPVVVIFKYKAWLTDVTLNIGLTFQKPLSKRFKVRIFKQFDVYIFLQFQDYLIAEIEYEYYSFLKHRRERNFLHFLLIISSFQILALNIKKLTLITLNMFDQCIFFSAPLS